MAINAYIGASTYEKYNLPEGYTQLTYIESTGTQYINTEVIGKSGLEADIKLSFTSISAYGILSSLKDGVRIYMVQVANSKWGYGYGSYVDSGVAPQANQIYNVYSKMYAGEQILKVNGSTIKSGTNTSTYNNNTALLLLAYSNAGTAANFCSAKLYSCHIYDNGTLIRDFVPVKNSDNVAGLYDVVEGKFYANAGTGTFTEGDVATDTTAHTIKKMYLGIKEVYTELEYIQSSGTQYINTGFKHNQDTRVVMDVQLVSPASSNWWLFGARTTNYEYRHDVFYYGGSTKLLTTDYNSSSENRTGFSTVNPSDRLLIDYNKNICTINNETVTHTAETFQCGYDLYLLAINTSSTSYGYAHAKLYSCQIYDNGILIRDYVPVKSSSGVVGLYDKIEGKFYGNAGTGTFVAGAELNNKIYVDVARKVKKAYIGNSLGIAKLVFRSEKANGSISISPTSITFNSSTLSKIIEVSRLGTAPVIATSSDTTVAEVNTSGTSITVSSVNKTAGTATITITVPDNDDYTSVSITCKVTASFSVSYSGLTTSLPNNKTCGISTGNYALFVGDSTNGTTAYNKSLTVSSAVGCAAASGETVADYTITASGKNINAYNTSLVLTNVSTSFGTGDSPRALKVGDYVLFCGGNGYENTCAISSSLTGIVLDKLPSSGYFGTGASLSSYAIITGGHTGSYSSTVYAYDASLTRTTVPTAAYAHVNGRGASTGSLAMFAGGWTSNWSPSTNTAAYNNSLTKLSSPTMTKKREDHAATAIGGYILYGFGSTVPPHTSGYQISYMNSDVDIFSPSLTKTNVADAGGGARYELSAASVGTYALFAGGDSYTTYGYDKANNAVSTFTVN